jgi:signal peptidase I
VTEPADGAPEGAPAEAAATEPAVVAEGEPKKKKQGSFVRELPFLLLIAFVLALVIKTFFVQAFFIPSGSMEQTLHGCAGCKGDRVLVNKLVYDFRDINRGEIVVFNGTGLPWQPEVFIPPPRNTLESIRRKVSGAIGLGTPGERDFIKRVIGLEGDTVACCDDRGRVTVNGVALDEPYLFNDNREKFERTVPKGHVFVMGDQRGRSSDSRAHGTVPESKIIGRAFVVIWPPSRVKGLRVPGEIENAGVPDPPPASPGPPIGAPPWSVAATPPVLGLLGAVPVTLVRRRVRQRLRQRRSARS